MSDGYQGILVRQAQQFYSLRTEQERARKELMEVQDRFNRISNQVQSVEDELCNSVGNNIQKRLFKVDTGRYVLVRFVNSTFKCCEVLEEETTV